MFSPSRIRFSIPLTTPFRGVSQRSGELFRGAVGLGEYSPFDDYDDAARAQWLQAAREAADVGWPTPVRAQIPVNVTIPAVGPERARELVRAGGGCRTAKVKVAARVAPAGDRGLDTPLCGTRPTAGHGLDTPLPGGSGTRPTQQRGTRPTGGRGLDTPLPGGSGTRPTQQRGTRPTPQALEPLDAEVARVAAVRTALDERFGPGVGKIRIDANGAWTVAEAVEHLRELDQVAGGLEYVEQPCATVEELADLRRALSRAGLDILVAADESIRRAEDPLRVAALEAADIAVLKVHPLGGVRACLALAEAIKLPVVVSSALETSIGMAAGLAFAGALPELPYACGLATVNLFAHDVIADPLLPVDGTLPVLPSGHPRLTPKDEFNG